MYGLTFSTRAYVYHAATNLNLNVSVIRELKHQTFFGRRRRLQTSEHEYEGTVVPAKIQT